MYVNVKFKASPVRQRSDEVATKRFLGGGGRPTIHSDEPVRRCRFACVGLKLSYLLPVGFVVSFHQAVSPSPSWAKSSKPSPAQHSRHLIAADRRRMPEPSVCVLPPRNLFDAGTSSGNAILPFSVDHERNLVQIEKSISSSTTSSPRRDVNSVVPPQTSSPIPHPPSPISLAKCPSA